METYYIYKLSYEKELLYIGSTNDVDKRINKHNSELKNNPTMYFHEYLRDNNLNFDDLDLIIINFDCNNNQDRFDYEYSLIQELKPKCNIHDGSFDMKEYQKSPQYKEYKKEYQKEYKKSPQYKEYQKQYRENNKDEIKEYQKQYQKEYRENNKL